MMNLVNFNVILILKLWLLDLISILHTESFALQVCIFNPVVNLLHLTMIIMLETRVMVIDLLQEQGVLLKQLKLELKKKPKLWVNLQFYFMN